MVPGIAIQFNTQRKCLEFFNEMAKAITVSVNFQMSWRTPIQNNTGEMIENQTIYLIWNVPEQEEAIQEIKNYLLGENLTYFAPLKRQQHKTHLCSFFQYIHQQYLQSSLLCVNTGNKKLNQKDGQPSLSHVIEAGTTTHHPKPLVEKESAVIEKTPTHIELVEEHSSVIEEYGKPSTEVIDVSFTGLLHNMLNEDHTKAGSGEEQADEPSINNGITGEESIFNNNVSDREDKHDGIVEEDALTIILKNLPPPSDDDIGNAPVSVKQLVPMLETFNKDVRRKLLNQNCVLMKCLKSTKKQLKTTQEELLVVQNQLKTTEDLKDRLEEVAKVVERRGKRLRDLENQVGKHEANLITNNRTWGKYKPDIDRVLKRLSIPAEDLLYEFFNEELRKKLKTK